ncbi:MAG: UvrD-helicase domain-containing protein [Carbonactinosporaceae bacterium]
MPFYADLHVHSKYSRACSRDCDIEHLAWWARRKGVRVVGSGDFTHPAWCEELRQALVPAEPGLFRPRDDLDRDVLRRLPASCQAPVSFMLSVEISTIYKRGERTRKVHHLVYVPGFDEAEAFTRRLRRIGNLASDGRPILGLDSRDLLEIALESGGYLVPAHVWTPWFAALGSKSGFDAIDDCYADLAGHIFALETGLSSDPAMNWRLSALDRYRLVSNSDAHSPPMLGREASLFDTEPSYEAIRRALETGEGFGGTIEFFPEEGKYHLDGHRKCGVRLDPAETRSHGGRCPACGKPLTVGVLHRVEELADRAAGARPDGAAGYRSLVPLPEIVSELRGVGPRSKTVLGEVATLVGRLGPELAVLQDIPLDAIAARGSVELAEAVDRLRRGQVIRESGYDGEYGVITLFEPAQRPAAERALFDTASIVAPAPRDAALPTPRNPAGASAPAARGRAARDGQGPAALLPAARPTHGGGTAAAGPVAGLDPDQRAAAALPPGPVLIVAGPGTGKTRTLTHRIAHLVTGAGAGHGVAPEHCLAITFTRRACEEMRERLADLLPGQAARIAVTTFHGLGAQILREEHARAGLGAGFRIADDTRRLAVLHDVARAGGSRSTRRLLDQLSRAKREASAPQEIAETLQRYDVALRERDLVDFDDLVALPVELLDGAPDLARRYRERYRHVFVDEYQDVDELQYRLLRLLADGDLCVIGDPDQSIYRFRGADVGFFLRFGTDFPTARTVQLTRNYRSSPTIVRAALSVIEPATLVSGRVLQATGGPAAAASRIGVHEAADEGGEADFVLRTIDALLGGSSFHSLDSGLVDSDGHGGLSFADFAVLYRTDAQSGPLCDTLSRAGVPYQKRAHSRLGDRPGVREILERLPDGRPGGAAGVLQVRTHVRDAAQAAIDSAGGPAMPTMRHRSAGTAMEARDQLSPQMSAQLSARMSDGYGDSGREAEIRSAVELLTPLAEQCGADLARFHAELALGTEVDTWDPRADRVSLFTLHAAKGLEFPVVFIVGCEDDLLPLRWSRRVDGAAGAGEAGGRAGEAGGRAGAGDGDRDQELAEERRLFFVGMTRAQSHLYLTRARRRASRGSVRDTRASPFLAALEGAVTERLGRAPAQRRRRSDQLKLL